MDRPLFLGGFMATGKSTVGRRLAERLGRPFVDLDERLAARLGASIPEFFARAGEPAFRREERRELERVLDERPSAAPVVALGGGALLARDIRLRTLDAAVVVTLRASPAEIARRAGGTSGRPVLGSDDTERRAAELLAQRAAAYAEAHASIPTDGRSVEDVADDALAVWRRDPIAVAAGDRSYAVDVGGDLVAERLPALVHGASHALLVTDANVEPLHGAALRAALSGTTSPSTTLVLAPGEREKHLGSCETIWSAALAAGADRKSVFLGLGGGVVTDVTGFAASAWMRGVRWIGVPTTLLAMVDASVGGKTGVDLAQAKNAVGAFWQPSGVLCDARLEATEPVRGYVSALAEVVKTGMIGDPGLLELLEANLGRVRARDAALVAELVRRSVRVKARIVSLDEREGGLRAVLNLGHTLGHALEAYAGYERLTHGEAVSLGLVAALRIGEELGQTPAELRERGVRLLGELGLPTDLRREPLAEAVELVGHDKKRSGKRLNFVVARELGRVEVQELELEALPRLARSIA